MTVLFCVSEYSRIVCTRRYKMFAMFVPETAMRSSVLVASQIIKVIVKDIRCFILKKGNLIKNDFKNTVGL